MPSRLIAPAPAVSQGHIPVPAKVSGHISVPLESSLGPASIPVATISGQQVEAMPIAELLLLMVSLSIPTECCYNIKKYE